MSAGFIAILLFNAVVLGIAAWEAWKTRNNNTEHTEFIAEKKQKWEEVHKAQDEMVAKYANKLVIIPLKTDKTPEQLLCKPFPAGPVTSMEIWRNGVFIGHPVSDGNFNYTENQPQVGDWITWRMENGDTITYPIVDWP